MRTRHPLPVVLHHGDTLELSTKVLSGRAVVADNALSVSGPDAFSLRLDTVSDVVLERLQLGHVIRVVHDGGTLWLAVYRINLFGQFVIFNLWATSRLAKLLRDICTTAA